MSRELRFETYGIAGTREWMMRCGTNHHPQVLVLTPLFHEANRLRSLAAALMRRLADGGVASVLPDLPGCGESLSPLPETLAAWQEATAAVAEATGASATLSIRTGALLDGVVPTGRRWRLSPATGASLARDLVRSRAVEQREAGGRESADAIATGARAAVTRLAGYPVPPGLFTALEAAMPDPDAAHTLRLAGDDRPADARLAGPMLWRQPEPSFDAEFADALASDFLSWSITCAGF